MARFTVAPRRHALRGNSKKIQVPADSRTRHHVRQLAPVLIQTTQGAFLLAFSKKTGPRMFRFARQTLVPQFKRCPAEKYVDMEIMFHNNYEARDECIRETCPRFRCQSHKTGFNFSACTRLWSWMWTCHRDSLWSGKRITGKASPLVTGAA